MCEGASNNPKTTRILQAAFPVLKFLDPLLAIASPPPCPTYYNVPQHPCVNLFYVLKLIICYVGSKLKKNPVPNYVYLCKREKTKAHVTGQNAGIHIVHGVGNYDRRPS